MRDGLSDADDERDFSVASKWDPVRDTFRLEIALASTKPAIQGPLPDQHFSRAVVPQAVQAARTLEARRGDALRTFDWKSFMEPVLCYRELLYRSLCWLDVRARAHAALQPDRGRVHEPEFTVLHAVESPDSEARAFLLDRELPFELDVLHAKLKYWTCDHMAYLDALAALLARCTGRGKARARKDGPTDSEAIWTERGARVCLFIASQLPIGVQNDWTCLALKLKTEQVR
ncbi:hypothetical protein GSI_03507 [Ganoderma sinense ZZ0214-1]|uniref:Uncharacterized protein n=1 Tax=Ganoderma sinense ZZ0214-1 TaxID=1077348 RepID=A0A2G8SLS3_9APHY|nr:hypothetical protein GSI_03507 [Ganoderma sinense ZZ0214-1]